MCRASNDFTIMFLTGAGDPAPVKKQCHTSDGSMTRLLTGAGYPVPGFILSLCQTWSMIALILFRYVFRAYYMLLLNLLQAPLAFFQLYHELVMSLLCIIFI